MKDILIGNLNNLILDKNVNTKEIGSGKRNVMNFEHKSDQISNFQGIIYYLESKYGSNLHEQGIITISASSTNPGSSTWGGFNNNNNNTAEKVIDYNWNGYWSSSGVIGDWLEIDFKQRKVKINGYSLKTHNYPTNYTHLKNWVIEGSNDRNNWVQIN